MGPQALGGSRWKKEAAMAITDQTAAARRPETSVHLNNASATGRAAARAMTSVGGRRPAMTGTLPGIEVSTTGAQRPRGTYAEDKLQESLPAQGRLHILSVDLRRPSMSEGLPGQRSGRKSRSTLSTAGATIPPTGATASSPSRRRLSSRWSLWRRPGPAMRRRSGTASPLC